MSKKESKCDYATGLVYAFNMGLIDKMKKKFWDSGVRNATFAISCDYLHKECKKNDVAEAYCGGYWKKKRRR